MTLKKIQIYFIKYNRTHMICLLFVRNSFFNQLDVKDVFKLNIYIWFN